MRPTGHKYFSDEKFRDPDSLAFARSVLAIVYPHNLTTSAILNLNSKFLTSCGYSILYRIFNIFQVTIQILTLNLSRIDSSVCIYNLPNIRLYCEI